MIEEARSWLETKFKHQGRVKISASDAGGCDCLGFILGLGIKTKTGKLLKDFDQANYPKSLNSNILLERLDLLLERVDPLRPGDIILLKINNWPQHLAFVTAVEPEITIIHSYLQARKVVEQYLPKDWEIMAIYRV